MKILCMSGGGSRGANSAGVIKHLIGDLETKYDGFAGISVGSINSAGLSMFKSGEEKEASKFLLDMWTSLDPKQVYKRWFPLGKIQALWNNSLYDSRPLGKFLNKHLDKEKIKSSGKKLRMGAVSLNTGGYKVFDENYEDLVGAIMASSAFPMAFCPVELEGQLWLDGGLREVIPLQAAIDMGATEIDIITTGPLRSKLDFPKKPGFADVGLRTIDLMSDEIVLNDIYEAIENDSGIKFRIFKPSEHLPDSLDFSQENIQYMIKKGYEDARKITGQ
jgi:NTE family protein